MPDWQLVQQTPRAAYWREGAGDVISLTLVSGSSALPSLSDEGDLRRYRRDVAQSQRAGLVEVATVDGVEGQCLTYVHKNGATSLPTSRRESGPLHLHPRPRRVLGARPHFTCEMSSTEGLP
jgi:hypothetical protein